MLQRAYIYEYDEGGERGSIDRAMNIYRKLENNYNQKIVKSAKSGLQRLPIYIFLAQVIPTVREFYRDKISYSALENKLLSINLNNIPPDLKKTYINMRLPLLKIAKYYEENNSLGNTLWTLGKSAVKGFVFDFSFITDALDSMDQDKQMKQVRTELNHYNSLFFDELDNLKISWSFWDSLQR